MRKKIVVLLLVITCLSIRAAATYQGHTRSPAQRPPNQQQPHYSNHYHTANAYQANSNSANSVTSYDQHRQRPALVPTHYPSYPHPFHYQQPTSPQCDMPPDLWCDSPMVLQQQIMREYQIQAAQACGVQRQCDALRRQSKPIKVSLMYEALCPYCQKFIANQLGTIVNQFRGQFELELVPWGNARILRDGSFSCNHGQKECDANRLQSCVIDVLGVQSALPFIVCLERALHNNPVEGAIHHCTAFVRNQYRQIRHCYDSERGKQLQRQAAHKTMSTKPNAIVEVPYLLINDYTPDTDTNNLNVMMLPQLLQKWTKLYRK